MSGVGSPLVACRRRVAPRRSLGSIVVRATCAATVARGALVISTTTRDEKNECRFRQRSLSFARGRVGRVGVASHMSGVGSPLVACRRRVAPRRSLGSIVVRATCAATVARGALVVSTTTRDEKNECRFRQRSLSFARGRVGRVGVASHMSGVGSPLVACRRRVAPRRSLGPIVVRATCAATVARGALVVSTATRDEKNECRFRQRSLSFARGRVGRVGVASHMSGVGSPLVACRRRVAPRRSLGSIVVRATCAATVARGALVVSTTTRDEKNECRFRQRSLSFARGRVGRVGVASHMSGVGSPLVACRRRVAPRRSLGPIVVRATCAATVARGALVVSTTTRDEKNECRFRQRSLSFARGRVDRVGVASHMSGVGSPLVACRRRVAPRRSLGSIVVRATCAATVARGALVVSTTTRDGKTSVVFDRGHCRSRVGVSVASALPLT